MNPKIKIKIENRQVANRELLKVLSEYVEKYPQQRFGQILVNYGFVTQGDPFYEESVDTLEKVNHIINVNNI